MQNYDDGSGYGAALDYQGGDPNDPTKKYQIGPYGSKAKTAQEIQDAENNNPSKALDAVASRVDAQTAQQGTKSKNAFAQFFSMFGGG